MAGRGRWAMTLAGLLVVSVGLYVTFQVLFDWFDNGPRAVVQGLLNGLLLFTGFALMARRRRQAGD